jgi:hypothetical protein
MRGLYLAGIIALLLTPNSSWLQIAKAQADRSEIVCWGDNEDRCKERQYTYFAPCGFLGHSGANPPAMITYLCGSEPGGKPKGSSTSISVGNPGGKCGYAWFRVVCN